MKLAVDFYLSETKNFKVNEFLSNEDKTNPTFEHISNLTRLVVAADKFRAFVKKNMLVTAGFRSDKYNAEVGGDEGSYHLDALAMDFELGYWSGSKWVEDYGDWTTETLCAIAEASGFRNIGIYIDKTTRKIKWLHCDIGKPWGTSYEWKIYSDKLSYKVYER